MVVHQAGIAHVEAARVQHLLDCVCRCVVCEMAAWVGEEPLVGFATTSGRDCRDSALQFGAPVSACELHEPAPTYIVPHLTNEAQTAPSPDRRASTDLAAGSPCPRETDRGARLHDQE